MPTVNPSSPAALRLRAVACIALCGLVDSACSRGGTAAIGSRTATDLRPGPRSGHNLVFDPVAGRTLLLFGYTGTTLPARPEIWAWKGGEWSIVDRHGPGFRSLAGVDVDTAGRRLLVFGGAGPGYRSRMETRGRGTARGPRWWRRPAPGPSTTTRRRTIRGAEC